MNGTLFEYENLIRAASTAGEIGNLDDQLQATELVGGQMNAASPAMNNAGKAVTNCMAYLEQATQIKITENQDGDAVDASGEVDSRLKEAHQLALNSHALDFKSGWKQGFKKAPQFSLRGFQFSFSRSSNFPGMPR